MEETGDCEKGSEGKGRREEGNEICQACFDVQL